MQLRLARTHSRFGFGPNFRLDTTATNGTRDFSVFEEEHLRATLLGRRATRMRDCSDDHSLTARTGFIDQAIEFTLWNR